MDTPRDDVQALTFDVFGTVVDWKGTIAAEGRRITGGRAPNMEWGAFAEAWMRSYGKRVAAMKEWTNLDVMLALAFGNWSRSFGLDWMDVDEATELATVWSRLRPWPDAVTGFARLRGRFTLAALTNANVAMLDGLARSSGLPWDLLLSAEVVRAYKPAPAVYRMALDRLRLPPGRVMMVASHCFDLNAARRQGMRTALVQREGEPGSDPSGLDHTPDVVVADLDRFADWMTSAREDGPGSAQG